MSDDGKAKATEEQLLFLDALRESGVVNMFGAGPFIEREFGVSREKARGVLAEWMRTFAERHPRSTPGAPPDEGARP
ncbi:MAG TPA: hypothetical protein VFI25_11355 [Planctomycetota bacterium]|jgi:hypothetical protein|nr:hypothetical protein [Planctomycetota bacterium]